MTAEHSTESPELQILKAVQALDLKLSTALTKQTQTLTSSIQALADRHSDSLLEQEKRNATFADRNRVEAVAETNHANANHIQSLMLRVTSTEKKLADLAADLQAVRSSMTEKAIGFLAGANGYLVMFLIMIAVGIVTAIVSRTLK
jgi:Flp pilus assembly protein TadB